MALRDHITADRSRSRAQHLPDRTVPSVKEAFAVGKLELRPETSNLASDSSRRSTVAAGLSTTACFGCQVVFEGSAHTMTLRWARGPGWPERIELVGEILHKERGPVEGIPVCLLAGYRVLGLSVSGDLGDFSLRYDLQDDVELRLLMSPEQFVEVDLDAGNGSQAGSGVGFSPSRGRVFDSVSKMGVGYIKSPSAPPHVIEGLIFDSTESF